MPLSVVPFDFRFAGEAKLLSLEPVSIKLKALRNFYTYLKAFRMGHILCVGQWE